MSKEGWETMQLFGLLLFIGFCYYVFFKSLKGGK